MTPANAAQIEHWNSPDARQWVDQQLEHDRQLEPFGRAVLGAAAIGSRSSVLDIGCGCGATTLQAALVGKEVLGVDVSKPMIDRARADAVTRGIANVEFLEADAQTYRFGVERVDIAISRFGVMFFDDPVAAFSNIATTLRPDSRLVFCCWQALTRNDWLLLPGHGCRRAPGSARTRTAARARSPWPSPMRWSPCLADRRGSPT